MSLNSDLCDVRDLNLRRGTSLTSIEVCLYKCDGKKSIRYSLNFFSGNKHVGDLKDVRKGDHKSYDSLCAAIKKVFGKSFYVFPGNATEN